jgi:hypothetical protein
MNTAFRIYRVDKDEGVRVFLMWKTNFAGPRELERWARKQFTGVDGSNW